MPIVTTEMQQLDLFSYSPEEAPTLEIPRWRQMRLPPKGQSERRLLSLGMIKCPDRRIIWFRGRTCPHCGAAAVLKPFGGDKRLYCGFCLASVDGEYDDLASPTQGANFFHFEPLSYSPV